MVVLIVIAVVMIALGVLLLKGKADRFIAGYNTASEEERKKVNIKRLRLVVFAFWFFLTFQSTKNLVVRYLFYWE